MTISPVCSEVCDRLRFYCAAEQFYLLLLRMFHHSPDRLASKNGISIMPSFVSTSDDSVRNMSDITSDFECLRLSALLKASRVSDIITSVTLGPDAVNENDEISTEDVENKKNTYNILTQKAPEVKQERKSRSSLIFSTKKILLENEIQRREEVRKAVEKRRLEMEHLEKALHQEIVHMQNILASQRESEEAAQQAKLEAEEETFERQNEIRRRHEQQLYAQRRLERKERFDREAEEYKIQKEREAVVVHHRNLMRERCRDFGVSSKACKDKNSVTQCLSPFTNKLKELNQQMEAINEKARKGKLTSADVSNAESISRQSEDLLNFSKLEIAKIDAAYDQEIARREQEMKQAQADAANIALQAQVNQPRPDTSQKLLETPSEGAALAIENRTEIDSSIGDTAVADTESYPDNENLRIYINSRMLIDELTGASVYEEFIHSPEWKKFRFDCQKAISIPINTLSVAAGATLITNKYQQLRQFFDGKSTPNINDHPVAPIFCKILLANYIVNQGETMVSSKPEAAFGIATVALAMMCDDPEFTKILLAQFRTTCPYLIPVFLPKISGQTEKQYFETLGYTCKAGVLEKEYLFLKRMEGVMTLYAAIIVSDRRRGVTVPHPLGLQNAWKWLAATLNFEIRPEFLNISVTLVLTMLEVVGNAMWNTYNRQFHKLLLTIGNQYYPRVHQLLKEDVVGGPISRLGTFVQDSLNKSFIPSPDGKLDPNFW